MIHRYFVAYTYQVISGTYHFGNRIIEIEYLIDSEDIVQDLEKGFANILFEVNSIVTSKVTIHNFIKL